MRQVAIRVIVRSMWTTYVQAGWPEPVIFNLTFLFWFDTQKYVAQHYLLVQRIAARTGDVGILPLGHYTGVSDQTSCRANVAGLSPR